MVAAATTAVIGPIAAISGLLQVRPAWEVASLSVFLVPAFTEELIFRGFVPSRGEVNHAPLCIAASVLAFTVWHVVEAVTFLPGATIFLTPGFLLVAAVLGLACALMRYRTGSLWPAVVFHGVLVFVWINLLGGPDIAELIDRM